MRPLGFLNPYYTFWISGKTTKGKRAGVHEQASNSLFDFSRRWRTVARCNRKRTRGTNEDRYITLDHCQARSFQTSAPFFRARIRYKGKPTSTRSRRLDFSALNYLSFEKTELSRGKICHRSNTDEFSPIFFEISRCTYVRFHLSSFDANNCRLLTVG